MLKFKLIPLIILGLSNVLLAQNSFIKVVKKDYRVESPTTIYTVHKKLGLFKHDTVEVLTTTIGPIRDTIEIYNINNVVQSVYSEKGLLIKKSEAIEIKHSVDTLTWTQKFDSVKFYFKENDLLRIQLYESREKQNKFEINWSVPGTINYIFNKGELVYIDESYTNCSRMGSCGCQGIRNELYFTDEDTLFYSVTHGNCYDASIISTEYYINILRQLNLK